MVTATKALVRKRGAIFVLLFLLFSCHPADPFCWKIENSENFGSFYTGKVYLSPESCIQGVEVEVAHSPAGLRLYLNLKFTPVCPENDLLQTMEIHYRISDEEFTSFAYVFEGGQRLLLTDDARDRILTALALGCSVHLTVANYSSDIPSLNFPVVYKKIVK